MPMRIGAEPAPGVLRGHIARANPLWKEYRSDIEALAIFQGPHTYISPALYPSKKTTGEVVPTWNYAAGGMRAAHCASFTMRSGCATLCLLSLMSMKRSARSRGKLPMLRNLT